MDAVRVSLSQLFLGADLVVIARIESVQDRDFSDEENFTRYEVVSAAITEQYKGEALSRVEFFQDAHGHAHYQAGDTAVLFLQQMNEGHQLYRIGHLGGVAYVSHQARNTEHRVSAGDLDDYKWILNAYAAPPTANKSSMQGQTLRVKEILLRMLASRSADITESALLDWETIGQAIQLDDAEIGTLQALTRDSTRPINMRLALLRSLSRRKLVGEDAWIYLLERENDKDLLLVLRSTQGFESSEFTRYIVNLLDHPTADLVEGAARALGHPAYSGAENALTPLLNADDPRLNYAAVSALLGINSQHSRALLQDAAANHSNAKIRRLITARINVIG